MADKLRHDSQDLAAAAKCADDLYSEWDLECEERGEYGETFLHAWLRFVN